MLHARAGGRLHATGSSWLVAGLATVGVVLLALAVAFGLGRRPGASGTRRAAVLGVATGISWGFMAAVIAAAAVLSHSCHLAGENSHPSDLAKPAVSSAANAFPAVLCRADPL
jgi:hypothetical protein